MSRPAVPRTVKGLALVSLCNDFASEMVYPLLPAFVTGVLGGGPVALGALDGAADLVSAALKYLSGRLADHPRWRKPLILGGYGTAVLIRPVIATASAAWQVVAYRVIDRVGKGLRGPARDALVADVTPPAIRGRAFGLHRAADHFGAVIGSLTAWWLLQRQVDVRDVIAWSAAPGVLVMLVLAGVLRDGTAARGAPSAPPAPAAAVATAVAPAMGPIMLLALLTVARLPETLLLLRLQDLGLAVALVPLAWAALHVVRTLTSYPGGILSDRVGPVATIAMGGMLFAALSWLLGNGPTPLQGAGLFLAMGLVTGLTESAERAMVAVLSPARLGRGFGAYQGLSGLLALPAALAFGLIYQRAGAPAAFQASAVAVVIAVGGWLVVGRRLAVSSGQ